MQGVMDMKRTNLVLAAAMMTVIGSACAARPVREAGGDIEMGSPASGATGRGANLRGIDGWNSLRGSAFALRTATGTQLSLTVEGGIPGSRYIWDLREGACGAKGTIVGGDSAYMAVEVGDRGMGSTITDVATALDATRDYSVNLYASATERTLVIACGRLAR